MGLGIPPLHINIMLESNPLKSIILVRRLAIKGAATIKVLEHGMLQSVTNKGCAARA